MMLTLFLVIGTLFPYNASAAWRLDTGTKFPFKCEDVWLGITFPINCSLKKLALIGGTAVGGGIIGKWIYDHFFKELSDIEELIKSEELYNRVIEYIHEIKQDCNKAFVVFGSHMDEREVSSYLRELIYQTRRVRPFLTYANRLEHMSHQLTRYVEQLINRRNHLAKRAFKLQYHDNQLLSAEERNRYLVDYECMQNKIIALEPVMQQMIDKTTYLKNHVVTLNEYTQERLQARLDEIEHKLSRIEFNQWTSDSHHWNTCHHHFR